MSLLLLTIYIKKNKKRKFKNTMQETRLMRIIIGLSEKNMLVHGVTAEQLCATAQQQLRDMPGLHDGTDTDFDDALDAYIAVRQALCSVLHFPRVRSHHLFRRRCATSRMWTST